VSILLCASLLHLRCARRTLNLSFFEAPAGQLLRYAEDCLFSCSSYLRFVCLSFPQYFSIQQATIQNGCYCHSPFAYNPRGEESLKSKIWSYETIWKNNMREAYKVCSSSDLMQDWCYYRGDNRNARLIYTFKRKHAKNRKSNKWRRIRRCTWRVQNICFVGWMFESVREREQF